MATRHNLCLNPALANDTTGWGGGSAPARTDVSSLGFGRGWAARYTSGSFLATAATQSGAVVAGQTYTLSVYYRPTSFAASGTLYIEWINGSGGGFGYPNVPFSGGAATISRASITEVAPAGAVAAKIILDGINFGVSAMDATMVLIEQSGAADTYFDGASPGASWDGAAGNSASTLTDTLTVAVTARGPLVLGGAAVARKAAPASGRGAVTVSGAATTRKVAPASGRGVLALAARGTARKNLSAVGRAELAFSALGTARKAAPASGAAPLGLAGRSVARKATAAAGTSYVLLGGYHSQVTSRPVTGISSLALGGRSLAVKVAHAAGTAPMALAGTATARRIAAATGIGTFLLAGNGAGRHRATAAGSTSLLLAGAAASRRVTAVTGYGVLLLAARMDLRADTPPAHLTSASRAVAVMSSSSGLVVAFHAGEA